MDAKSPTTQRKLTAAQRRDQALQRRIGGFTFQEIGDELGITRQSAHGLVVTALKELNEKTMESAEELKRVMKEQLAAMTYAIWGQVLAGDLGAVAAMDRIQKRLAALDGLDAAKKLNLDGKVINEVVIRYESNSDNAPDDARGTTEDKE